MSLINKLNPIQIKQTNYVDASVFKNVMTIRLKWRIIPNEIGLQTIARWSLLRCKHKQGLSAKYRRFYGKEQKITIVLKMVMKTLIVTVLCTKRNVHCLFICLFIYMYFIQQRFPLTSVISTDSISELIKQTGLLVKCDITWIIVNMHKTCDLNW